MKFIVDHMPKNMRKCPFATGVFIYGKDKVGYKCQMDQKNCNLKQGSYIQYTSCRWLKENN